MPPYWRRIRPHNLAGVPPLGMLPGPPSLPPDEFDQRRRAGAIVLDTRAPEAYGGGGHIPGALNVGLGPAFATWAGTVLPADADILLVVDRPEDVWEATWHLLRIGYRTPVGWLSGAMTTLRTATRPIETTPQITVYDLKQLLDRGEVHLLDVRQPAEWAAGHTPGAIFIAAAQLPERLDDVPDDKPIAVTCSTGYRSSIAASLLARRENTATRTHRR